MNILITDDTEFAEITLTDFQYKTIKLADEGRTPVESMQRAIFTHLGRCNKEARRLYAKMRLDTMDELELDSLVQEIEKKKLNDEKIRAGADIVSHR
jgi:hypothetical protein